MSQQQINLSPDIVKLRNDGYAVEIRGAHLLIHDIPYVNRDRKIAVGTLASDLTLAGDCSVKPKTHVAYFVGAQPCHRDGTPITQIMHSVCNKPLGEGLIATLSFSNKPTGGYADHYDKMVRYIEIISAPAKSIEETVTAQTFRVVESAEEDPVFVYTDTSSSRAGIDVISAKLKNHRIGIIGLGGTGAYVLDLLAKTPVAQIRLFDGDDFLQHNAFRTPGAAPIERLRDKPKKVEYLAEVYSKIHKKISFLPEPITASNVEELRGLDFVFICIDGGRRKRLIVEFLQTSSIPFIDVGMGVNIVDDNLFGVVRTTTSTPTQNAHVGTRISFDDSEHDEYSTNIQIADLNMLNAAFGVIKWKKICGFYLDLEREHHCTYTIDGNSLTKEDCET